MRKATARLKSAVALTAALAASGDEALGQGGSGCRGAGPLDRPPMSWSRIEEGRTYSAYLDFGSFCRQGRMREARVMLDLASPRRTPGNHPLAPNAVHSSVVEHARYYCGETAFSVQRVEIYSGRYGTGTRLAAGTAPPNRSPLSPGTTGMTAYSYVCERDGYADVVTSICSYGPCLLC